MSLFIGRVGPTKTGGEVDPIKGPRRYCFLAFDPLNLAFEEPSDKTFVLRV